MDFIKKLLQFIEDSELEEIDGQFSKFKHSMEEENTERIVTMSTTKDGLMVMSIFTPDQWDMAIHIAEIAEKEIQEVVAELSNDGDIATIVIDPTEF